MTKPPAGPSIAELNAAGAFEAAGNHNVQAGSGLGASQPGELPMMPFEGKPIPIAAVGNADEIFHTGNMDDGFKEILGTSSALGNSITGDVEKIIDHHATASGKGEPGIALEKLGQTELSQNPPSPAGDLNQKGLSAKGNPGLEH